MTLKNLYTILVFTLLLEPITLNAMKRKRSPEFPTNEFDWTSFPERDIQQRTKQHKPNPQPAKTTESPSPKQLSIAATTEHSEFIQQTHTLELSKGDVFTYLIDAIQSHNLELAKKSIHNGAAVNGITVNHQTPLHYAIVAGNINIVEYLLAQKNININTPNDLGSTPLDLAILCYYNLSKKIEAQQPSNYLTIIKLLVKNLAFTNIIHENCMRALPPIRRILSMQKAYLQALYSFDYEALFNALRRTKEKDIHALAIKTAFHNKHIAMLCSLTNYCSMPAIISTLQEITNIPQLTLSGSNSTEKRMNGCYLLCTHMKNI